MVFFFCFSWVMGRMSQIIFTVNILIKMNSYKTFVFFHKMRVKAIVSWLFYFEVEIIRSSSDYIQSS